MAGTSTQPPTITDDGSRPPGESQRGFRYFSNILVDKFEWFFVSFIYVCGWSAILFVLAIFFFVFIEGLPAITGSGEGQLDLVDFFTNEKWIPESAKKPQFGIFAMLMGTLSVTVLSMLIAVPLGLGAAIYVSEFASNKTREILKVLIELLAAIPSVVWGFVGYMVLGPILLDTFDSAVVGINLLNGGIILALMSVPVIVSMSEDALRAVPDSYREAAMELGANRTEMVFKVLFPAAKHGLLAAVLLGVGRAIGETMAVLMCTGHAVQIPEGLLDPVRTLTATIAAELGETAPGDMHYQVLFVIGIVLFTFAFLINIIADVIVKGIRMEKHG